MKVIAVLSMILFKWTYLFGVPPWVAIPVLGLPTLALAYWYLRIKKRS
jgi:hypothetical protein